VRVERQPDHHLVDGLIGGHPREGRRVRGGVLAAVQRREGDRPPAVAVRDREPDAPFAEIDPQEPGHGLPLGPGGDAPGEAARGPPLDDPSWPTISRLTRESMLGTVETQSGHGLIATWPNGASAAFASGNDLPLTSASNSAGSR